VCGRSKENGKEVLLYTEKVVSPWSWVVVVDQPCHSVLPFFSYPKVALEYRGRAA
jgi:hypothetical protein